MITRLSRIVFLDLLLIAQVMQYIPTGDNQRPGVLSVLVIVYLNLVMLVYISKIETIHQLLIVNFMHVQIMQYMEPLKIPSLPTIILNRVRQRIYTYRVRTIRGYPIILFGMPVIRKYTS